jgi:hypothetical protein
MTDELASLPQELDYLREEPMQKEVLDVWHEELEVPQNEANARNLLISIPKSNDYTALHNSYLLVTCKVTKPKGEACNHAHATDPDKVCIVNNFAQSLWKNVKVSVNGVEVEDTNGLHPYRAYLEALFNHETKTLEKRGAIIGWSKDTPHKFDKNVKGGGNTGMDSRTKAFMNSAEVTLVSKLSCDMMEEKLYLPPQWTIGLRLERAPHNFVLIAGEETSAYEVHITSMKFFVQRIKVREELAAAHKKLFTALPDNKLRYATRRLSMSKHVVNKGVPNAKLDLFDNCTLPDRLLVAFISKTASEGLYVENPFNFMHKSVKKIFLQVNSKQVPRVAYEPDFSKPSGYIREFYEMLASVGAHEGNNTITLTSDEFGHGYTVFPFILVPRREHGALLGEQVIGKATLHLSFADATDDVFEVIALAETRAAFLFSNALKNPTDAV